MDKDKVGLKVEDGKEKKEEDDNDLEVSDKDVNGTNDDEEQERPKKTKEEIPKNLSFVKEVVDSAYMGFTRSPLPRNNVNLHLPFFGGNYPIVHLDNIY